MTKWCACSLLVYGLSLCESPAADNVAVHDESVSQRNAMLEANAAHAVIALLLTEGRTVSGLHRVPVGRNRTPDFGVTIDKERVALEVVRFIDGRTAKAGAGVELLEAALKRLLDPVAVQMKRKLVLDLTFAVEPLQDYGLREAARDADLLVETVASAAGGEPEHLVPIESAVAWVQQPSVFTYYAPADPCFFVGSTAPDRPFTSPDARAFVQWVIRKKGDQHIGYSETAILAVVSDFTAAEELGPALDTVDQPLPWRRVYNVQPGGNGRLVYEEAKH
jgi:hypothetical protein